MTVLELLPVLMFVALGLLLFTGYPVALILGGVGLGFAFIAELMGGFNVARLVIVPNRIFGGSMENPVLVAIPMFIFMGTMLEKSGVARDLLHCLQVLTRRIPGGLALSVTLMGTIMAATTGIIGASVVMMTLMALPVMLKRQYNVPLATGTIASSGTLGILIPPSIMLVIMSDLMSIPVGTVFIAAIIPGLLLSGLYMVYIMGLCFWKPHLAPPMPADEGLDDNDRAMGERMRRISPDSIPGSAWLVLAIAAFAAVFFTADWLQLAAVVVFLFAISAWGTSRNAAFTALLLRSFLPPVLLIVLVLGSIFKGYATPTEAAGVGAVGATLLALINRALSGSVLKDVCQRSALTTAMIFGIFVGATCFSLVFRWLGGDTLIEEFIAATGVGPWGILLVLMGMIFLLGFFFDWVEITLIVLPVFGPIVAGLDFGGHIGEWPGVAEAPLIWFTILVSVNLQTSFLTPPFGFALFYMKGVAPPEVKIQQIYKGIVPFVALQVIGLILVMIFPEIALWFPSFLLR
ncbi:TRAP transporter large permease [Rhodobium gokarnense]|uniref:TRAP-type mannitol/chloroaromatic compound transport system permease large subunit n=1 Tax=Rhodobium gokarnense TaxID=364296 RepID=A0ABT3HCK3_9HYPH|nr:TRAP transporter large permease subunit [Rhodobium gokarnense]MCW2308121.1 TRAP-type mannitol/chloroaromatic compound transport system permease large subunit [Rhodobium gokarnense]